MLVTTIAWTPNCGATAPDNEPVNYTLKIDRQSLGHALQELARQSGVQIIFFSQVTEGLQAPALNGQYTLAAALDILLKGSNLTFRVINSTTIEIRPVATDNSRGPAADRSAGVSNAATLRNRGPPRRSTDPDSGALDELVVNGTAEGLVATRTETPLRKIPQTVMVISQEQMRQENDTEVADALDNAVGITATRIDSLDEFIYSRGFLISQYHLDGGSGINLFSGTPDLGEFDHIEVLRGADALFGGMGNPGATISLVRKRPLDTNEVMFSESAGSWNNYRVEGDVTGPLGLDGALRGRLDVVYGHRGYFYDTARLETKNIFGALEYDLTSHTLLTVGGSYHWTNALPFYLGLPSYEDGSDPHLPRSTALAFNWSRYYTQTREIYVELQQEFAGDWKLKINATSLKQAAEFDYGEFLSPIDPVTKSLPVLPEEFFSTRPNTQNPLAFDTTLTGAFTWFGHRVEVAIGVDHTQFESFVAEGVVFSFGPPVNNVFAYNPGNYPTAPALSPNPDEGSILGNWKESGVYASSKVHLGDAWSVVGGARVSNDHISGLLINLAVKDTAKVTPYAGVMYDLNEHYSLYASYADIYQSNAGLRLPDGAYVPPADGVDEEAGIKGAWRDGTLNGFLVLYDIDQHGLAMYDVNASAVERSIPYCCDLPNGSRRSKGVDAELDGRLAPGWLIGAGYTFNINRDESVGDLAPATPRHLVKLWMSEQLPGRWRRWTVGGTLQAQSSNYFPEYACLQNYQVGYCQQYAPFKETQGSYAVVNLRTGYQVNSHWRAALSINNVFDRIYYQTIGYPASNSWYGEPRGFLLRLDARY